MSLPHPYLTTFAIRPYYQGMNDAMTILISNLFLVACYIVNASRSPVVLTKSPVVLARITAGRTVRAFAYGTEIQATTDDVIAAYKARKVTITDFGTSIVVQAKHGKHSSDTRFVVCA